MWVIHDIEGLTGGPQRDLSDKLKNFKDILINDNTIIRLHRSLADRFPSTRFKKVAADVKLGLLVSAVSNSLKSISIYDERRAPLPILAKNDR